MVSMPKRVEIRPFSPADVSAVANLLGQLGYPVESEALVLERHAALAADVQQAVLEAVQAWTTRFGNLRVRLGSGVHREQAHQFYEHLGYTKRAGFTFEKHMTAAVI